MNKRQSRMDALVLVRQKLMTDAKVLSGNALEGKANLGIGELQERVLGILREHGWEDLISAGFLRDSIGRGSLSTHSEFTKKVLSRHEHEANERLRWSEVDNFQNEKYQEPDAREREMNLMGRIELAFSRMESSISEIMLRLDSLESKIAQGSISAPCPGSVNELFGNDTLVSTIEKGIRSEILEPLEAKVDGLNKSLESINYFRSLLAQEIDKARNSENGFRQKVSEERDRANILEAEVFGLRQQVVDMRALLTLKVDGTQNKNGEMSDQND